MKTKLEQLDAGVLRWRTADRLLSVFSALYHEQRCDLQRCVLGVLWGLSAGDAVGALERAAGDTLDVQQVSQLLEGAMAAVPTLHRDHTGADSPAARLLWLRFAAALGITRACSFFCARWRAIHMLVRSELRYPGSLQGTCRTDS